MNLEIKALYNPLPETEDILNKLGAEFVSAETQTDTYFRVDNGRLKIRQIENGPSQLIQYFRNNTEGAKQCNYALVTLRDVNKISRMLKRVHGILVTVTKKRKIWIWRKVRIHLDEVENLGNYIEFEAMLSDEDIEDEAENKIGFLMRRLKVGEDAMIGESYSDLLLKQNNPESD